MKTLWISLICSLVSSTSFATTIIDGTISTLHTDSAGNVAVKLAEGFPQAVVNAECSTATGWAGVGAVNSALKAALLTAKATQTPVSLSISGCEAGGVWLKVIAVYLK